MLRRRFLFTKVVKEKPVYTYTYTTTDGLILDLKGVQNHKYENGVGSFETSSKSCISFKLLYTLESIIIPKGVTSIENNTFRNCSGLTSVEIGDGVTNIGDYAFRECTRLTGIEIPNSVTSIGNYSFYGCTDLASIEISNRVTSIGNRAFEDCPKLINVVIPNNVVSIGNRAFYRCTGLISVTIGNSVEVIGNLAFLECTKLKTVYNFSNLTFSKYSNNNGYVAYYATKVINAANAVIDGDFIWCNLNGANTLACYLGELAELTLPIDYNGENYVIGKDAFLACVNLTSITIPNSVKSIGEWAFYNCNSLKEVHIRDLASWCNIDFSDSYANPLYYAKNLYLNGEKLTELTIPDGIVEIKDYTFYNCTGLASVVIPNSVTNIGYNVFYDCHDLVNIVIPNSVTSIGDGAFNRCRGLTSVTIPNSVTSIGSDVFYECSSLTSIKIPESVTSIGQNAFYSCYGLTSIEIPNGVTSIGRSAFLGCRGLTSIEIPSKVTSIGNYAFSYCTQLNEIISLNPTPPVISSSTFGNVGTDGVLKISKGSDYSEWMKTDEYYLGYYNWTVEEI